MVDNNRVFFECLLEQVSHCTGSHLSTLYQVLAERNKEGLEERSWAEALAPRFDPLYIFILTSGSCADVANSSMPNNRCVHKALTWAAPRWGLIILQPLFRHFFHFITKPRCSLVPLWFIAIVGPRSSAFRPGLLLSCITFQDRPYFGPAWSHICLLASEVTIRYYWSFWFSPAAQQQSVKTVALHSLLQHNQYIDNSGNARKLTFFFMGGLP